MHFRLNLHGVSGEGSDGFCEASTSMDDEMSPLEEVEVGSEVN